MLDGAENVIDWNRFFVLVGIPLAHFVFGVGTIEMDIMYVYIDRTGYKNLTRIITYTSEGYSFHRILQKTPDTIPFAAYTFLM